MTLKFKSIKKSYLPALYFDISLFIISIIIILMDDKNEILPYIGFFIIIISIYLCYKVRDNEKLLFLFAIVGFINISIGLSDGIFLGTHVASWQMPLRETVNNVYAAKSILLFISIINLIIDKKWLDLKSIDLNPKKVTKKDNIVISSVGTAVMYLILLLGYDSNVQSSDVYVSNSNPLVEYAIVIFAVVWLYSGNNSLITFLLKLYAFIYVVYSMSFGDRSAAFLMILLYYLLYIRGKKKLSIKKVSFLALIAIFISNLIASYRENMDLNILSMIIGAVERGVYSDTVSYSYYASITITAAHHLDKTFIYFLEYIKTFLTGGGSSEFGNLANYVKENYLYNVGGGLYPSYFYFGLGYSGVALGAILMGFILRKIYSFNNRHALIFQILIPVLSIRWYLYGPTTFYRSILIITSLLLLICYLIDIIIKKRRFLIKIK